jgi:hypothetical protein
MSERPTLTAPAAARARAIAERLAHTNPAAASAYAEGEAHRANAEPRPAPLAKTERPPNGTSTQHSRDRPARLDLSAKTVKVTVVIPPDQLFGVVVPNGASKVDFRVSVGDRRLTGSFNAKSLRRAAAAAAEHGPEGCACVVQGKLVGEVVEEAGIICQPRGPKT